MIVGGGVGRNARSDSMTPMPRTLLQVEIDDDDVGRLALQIAHRVGFGLGEAEHLDFAGLGQEIEEPVAKRRRVLDQVDTQRAIAETVDPLARQRRVAGAGRRWSRVTR